MNGGSIAYELHSLAFVEDGLKESRKKFCCKVSFSQQGTASWSGQSRRANNLEAGKDLRQRLYTSMRTINLNIQPELEQNVLG